MHTTLESGFKRTDMWREGTWLDLWSVVHFLSGVSLGLGLFLFHFGTLAVILIALLLLTSYEMWEAMVKIEETPTNRFMDVVVGMVSCLPTIFFIAPKLHTSTFILTFGFVLTANIVLSIVGWQASQKAAALEMRMREKYISERGKLLRRQMQLRKKFRK